MSDVWLIAYSLSKDCFRTVKHINGYIYDSDTYILSGAAGPYQYSSKEDADRAIDERRTK